MSLFLEKSASRHDFKNDLLREEKIRLKSHKMVNGNAIISQLFYTDINKIRPNFAQIHFALKSSEMSPRGIMYMEKRVGPKTDPCGTPFLTQDLYNISSFTTSINDWSDKMPDPLMVTEFIRTVSCRCGASDLFKDGDSRINASSYPGDAREL